MGVRLAPTERDSELGPHLGTPSQQNQGHQYDHENGWYKPSVNRGLLLSLPCDPIVAQFLQMLPYASPFGEFLTPFHHFQVMFLTIFH